MFEKEAEEIANKKLCSERICYNHCNFNPYNWKHNTFIALHHLEWLQSKLKIQDDVIMAYNCGIGAVLNGRIPDTTVSYLVRTKNNLTLLKGL